MSKAMNTMDALTMSDEQVLALVASLSDEDRTFIEFVDGQEDGLVDDRFLSEQETQIARRLARKGALLIMQRRSDDGRYTEFERNGKVVDALLGNVDAAVKALDPDIAAAAEQMGFHLVHEAMKAIVANLMNEASRYTRDARRPTPKFRKGAHVFSTKLRVDVVLTVDSSAWFGESQGYFYYLTTEKPEGPLHMRHHNFFECDLLPAPEDVVASAKANSEGK